MPETTPMIQGASRQKSNTCTEEDDTLDNVEDLGDPAPEQQLDGSEGHVA